MGPLEGIFLPQAVPIEKPSFPLVVRLTFDLVSTFTSTLILLFLKEVFTSPANPSPFFTPEDVKAYNCRNVILVKENKTRKIDFPWQHKLAYIAD